MLEQYGLHLALGCAVIAILYGIISARWIGAQPAEERNQRTAVKIRLRGLVIFPADFQQGRAFAVRDVEAASRRLVRGRGFPDFAVCRVRAQECQRKRGRRPLRRRSQSSLLR